MRQDLIELARAGAFKGVTRGLPRLIHPARVDDAVLVGNVLAMAERGRAGLDCGRT